MRHIMLFNESVKELMTPKSDEDIRKAIEKLPPYKALAKAYSYKLDDVVKTCWERVKPINEKLYRDTKKFNKNNILEFVDFVSTWIDEQGGESYDIDEKFRSIAFDLSNRREEEEEEWEDDEGNTVQPPEVEVVESIYSDNTIKLYKQLVISYVIDYLSHNIYEREDEEEYYEEEDGGGMMYEEPSENELRMAEEQTRDQKIKLENERMEKEEKEKEEKRPINKIKKFLGFDKDDNKSK